MMIWGISGGRGHTSFLAAVTFVEFMYPAFTCKPVEILVTFVEFMYLEFTCKPVENYHRLFRYLLWNYLACTLNLLVSQLRITTHNSSLSKPAEILVLFVELFCTLHLLVSQLRITTGDSGTFCGIYVPCIDL